MDIIDNKAVRLRLKKPERLSIIPKHKVRAIDGGYEALVYFGLDEMRVLKNLGFKNVPSPIEYRYPWPGRYKPMEHQVKTSGFITMNRRSFILNQPGTGKTISALWAADYLMKRKEVRRCLIICPMSIMHSAWMGDLNNSIIHRSAIVAHHAQASRRIEMIQGDYEFVIINYDGVALVAEEIIANGKFDMIIVDECFVAGTQVATPHGNRSIEKLAVGEKVLTSGGAKRITRVVCNTSASLVTVRTTNGKETTCTADHPFFTDAGWVCAKNLVGRRLVRTYELCGLPNGVHDTKNTVGVGAIEGFERRDDLLTILRTETVPHDASGGELLQSYSSGTAGDIFGTSQIGRVPGEHVGSDESEGAQAERARRKRDGDDLLGEPCGTFAARTVGMELPSSIRPAARALSYKLQAGLCASNAQAGTGSGRELPQYVGKESTGSEEGCEAGGAWVESVTHHEQRGAVPVFNLEVEGAPNYFADGCLVHNCSAYSTSTTKRWKALAKIIRPDTYLIMMTGTPAAQSPLHAYGMAKLVNPNNVPNYFTKWRDMTMNKITMFKWAPKHDARDKVFAALQPAIRFTKDQCLDLPPVVKMTREVPMTPMQKKYYDKIKNDMLVTVAGQTISAVNKAAVVNKLLQVSCGSCLTEDGEVVEFDATPRMNVLVEILNETDRKVIIFAMYRSSIDGIEAFLKKSGYTVGVIDGRSTASRRGEIINSFQHTEHPQVLVMQPQASAHGITLTAADTVVFFGPLMSVELYVQAIARSDRKGQNSDKVTVVHIQSSPIEKKMFDAMDSKVTDHSLLTDMFDEEMQMKK